MYNFTLGCISVLAVFLVFASYQAEKNTNEWLNSPECQRDKLVSETDGVKLYVHAHCTNNPIYYSKSGTNWKECYSERHGKLSETVCHEKRVPNTQLFNKK